MSVRVGEADRAPAFPRAAHQLLSNTQLRFNVVRWVHIAEILAEGDNGGAQ